MSYGKWKALHPHTEVQVQKEEPKRRCIICGEEICVRQTGRSGRLYCSGACEAEAHRRRMRERYHKKKEMMADGKI